MAEYSWSGSLVPYYEQYLEPLRSLQAHKYAQVRGWAETMLKYVKHRIEQERSRDAEHELGVY